MNKTLQPRTKSKQIRRQRKPSAENVQLIVSGKEYEKTANDSCTRVYYKGFSNTCNLWFTQWQ